MLPSRLGLRLQILYICLSGVIRTNTCSEAFRVCRTATETVAGIEVSVVSHMDETILMPVDSVGVMDVVILMYFRVCVQGKHLGIVLLMGLVAVGPCA